MSWHQIASSWLDCWRGPNSYNDGSQSRADNTPAANSCSRSTIFIFLVSTQLRINSLTIAAYHLERKMWMLPPVPLFLSFFTVRIYMDSSPKFIYRNSNKFQRPNTCVLYWALMFKPMNRCERRNIN
jgi:hypothetical protein